MGKKYKGVSFLIVVLLMMTTVVYGQEGVVVTLGNNLNQQQRQQMLDIFGVKEDDVTILVVTNDEERAYLKGIATEAQIGTRSISSAYVKNLPSGEGIRVETYNIGWVTAEMYQNALVTAGVTDAHVIAAAPFNVSGTAALTGIFKAFEEVRGEAISEDRKRIANEEMVTTGKLGEEIGQERATQLIKDVKEEIVEKGVKDPAEIRKIIVETAGRLNISLTPQQIEDITKLMEQITKLNLSTDVIKQQLRGVGQQVGDMVRQNEGIRSFFTKMVDAIRGIFSSIFGRLRR